MGHTGNNQLHHHIPGVHRDWPIDTGRPFSTFYSIQNMQNMQNLLDQDFDFIQRRRSPTSQYQTLRKTIIRPMYSTFMQADILWSQLFTWKLASLALKRPFYAENVMDGDSRASILYYFSEILQLQFPIPGLLIDSAYESPEEMRSPSNYVGYVELRRITSN
ncbi:hypothetical protein PENSUB_9539 [Penicillium subrubescens]|uniref:Uncharacterized protein n=1 Tax=Penicillium subrubescens TaxID=1316194 RepID=A0A1Q5TD01_9EURO|nr:hypothetical protein PENSUB_9539 [Penicillium subrubescens]